ncbi:MAG: hypothetical protein HY831_03350 [Candidatus Aenigmarchaeota archaeon]|nr:hypothetical protein [Candidatus Aenigmarchaeota archaeon]
MENKINLVKFVFLIALFTLVLTGIASAAEITVGDMTVKVNGQVLDGGTLSVPTGSSFVIETVFTAVTDESDVRVKAWIEGYKSDIYKETERFDVINGTRYVKWLSLTLPGDIDATDDYKLIVRVSSRDKEDQKSYTLTVQRPSYKLEILSMEYVREVEAGDNLAVSVVVKNRGAHDVEDVYVTVAIPELGIQKRVYAGDLVPVDNDDEENAVEKTVVLAVPSNAKSGTYTLEAKVTNEGEEDKVTDTVTVKGTIAESTIEVAASQLTKEVTIGSSQVYRIEIVNPTDEVKVITIGTPASLEAQGVKVTATPSVVKIQPNSAETVEVSVQASDATTVGEYNLPVKISEGTGSDKVTKEVGITANVVKASGQGILGGNKIAVSTVILAIIFVVLLIVLFVSLGKRKEVVTTPGTGEDTTYY